jgi:hypothetical protein
LLVSSSRLIFKLLPCKEIVTHVHYHIWSHKFIGTRPNRFFFATNSGFLPQTHHNNTTNHGQIVRCARFVCSLCRRCSSSHHYLHLLRQWLHNKNRFLFGTLDWIFKLYSLSNQTNAACSDKKRAVQGGCYEYMTSGVYYMYNECSGSDDAPTQTVPNGWQSLKYSTVENCDFSGIYDISAGKLSQIHVLFKSDNGFFFSSERWF